MSTKTIAQPVLAVVMPIFGRFGNINHPCPYIGNVTADRLQIGNWILNRSSIPPGQHRMDVTGYNSQTGYNMLFYKSLLLPF